MKSSMMNPFLLLMMCPVNWPQHLSSPLKMKNIVIGRSGVMGHCQNSAPLTHHDVDTAHEDSLFGASLPIRCFNTFRETFYQFVRCHLRENNNYCYQYHIASRLIQRWTKTEIEKQLLALVFAANQRTFGTPKSRKTTTFLCIKRVHARYTDLFRGHDVGRIRNLY